MAVGKAAVCQNCGFKKNPPGSARCASCGAKLDDLDKTGARRDDPDRRYQQDGFSVLWFGIAFVVQAVLTGAIVFGLPLVIAKLFFEGGNGMLVCIPVWFVGGLLVGMISPGRTFIEPVLASILVAIPATVLLVQSQTVHTLPTFLYLILAAIGVLFTLVGSYLGERIQLGPAPKPSDS
jgi:hypothetical protein